MEDYQPLVQVCCWCIGEYGDLLLTPNAEVTADEVMDGFQQIMWSPHGSIITRQYCILALEKLSARVPETLDRVRLERPKTFSFLYQKIYHILIPIFYNCAGPSLTYLLHIST